MHGSLFYPRESPPRYQVATMDVRGVGVYNGRLFVTSSYLVEPNRDDEDVGGYQPWCVVGGCG